MPWSIYIIDFFHDIQWVFAQGIALDGVILLLGCRWLVATSDMGDLILNAVALEFLLVLNSLVLQAQTHQNLYIQSNYGVMMQNDSKICMWR